LWWTRAKKIAFLARGILGLDHTRVKEKNKGIRIEFNSKKERVGVFYENKLAYYHQNHGFMDGSQKYNLGFMGNSFGLKFMIHNPKNHEKKL